MATDKTPGTGGIYQVRDEDWDNLNRSFRLICNRLDALEGRRGNVPLGSNLDVNSNKVINSSDPTADGDLVTKRYADQHYGPSQVWNQLIISGDFPLPASALSPGSTTFVEDTHANRISSTFDPGGYPIGSGFWETDRTVMYIVALVGGINVWHWAGGVMVDTLANRPADLGTNDSGFKFVETTSTQNTEYVWNGTGWWTVGGFLQEVADATTAVSVTVQTRRHSTSGTAANGFGLAVADELEDSGGTNRIANYEEVAWSNAGTNSSLKRWWLRVAGTLTAVMGLESTGNLSVIGNILWKSATAFFGTLLHANTANRNYTFADADGNIVYETATLTNNNFIFGGGGALAKDSGFSVVPIANGGTGSSTGIVTPLFDHFADVGNSTTTETDLYSDTIAASQLATNGDKLEVEYGGVFVSSATATRQTRIYFGGTAIFDSGALTLSLSSAWTVFVTIIRVSATTVRYMVSFTTEGAALSAYTAVGSLGGLTLSNTNVLKVTGQAAGVGAASNDIVAKLGNVIFIKAA